MDNSILSDACNIKTGKLDSNQAVKGGQFPFFTCSALPDTIDKFAFDEDVVLIAGNNAQGNFHVSRFKGKFNAYQRTYILTAKNGYDIDFVYYSLKLELKRLKEKSQGSQTKFLTMPILNNIVLKRLSKVLQQKIASVLSALDSKIELNNRFNAELEAMAKTLYDYWFVQFDFPDKNGKPYKTSGGTLVWNEELKREIPEGWEVKLFSEWINNDKSGDWGKEQIEGNYTEKVYCIRGADINGLNGLGELKSPERYILEKNLHKTLDPADLIVEISGGSPTQSTGRLAFITEETLARFDAPIICSNFCKAVTLKNKTQLYNFVYHWKSIYDAGVLFGYEGKTSGIKNLLFESFVSSHFTVVPELSATNKFYDFMEQLESKKQKNLKENQKLTELRDWLLPMLMNGQVKAA
jgi:type I restriction enzyme S subunit